MLWRSLRDGVPHCPLTGRPVGGSSWNGTATAAGGSSMGIAARHGRLTSTMWGVMMTIVWKTFRLYARPITGIRPLVMQVDRVRRSSSRTNDLIVDIQAS